MQLQIIKKLLTSDTAISFADKKLSAVKEGVKKRNENYFEYMYQVFSGAEHPTIQECEANAISQFIAEYGQCCKMYAGWHKSGCLFILDRENLFVLFVSKIDGLRHTAVTHYNPLKYDCYEWSMSNNEFFEGMKNGRYDLSANEATLIKECDLLIKAKKETTQLE